MKSFTPLLFFIFCFHAAPAGAGSEAHEPLTRSFQSASTPPVWSFWKNTELASQKLDENQPQEALALLKDLPPPPSDPVNRNQDFYRKLYKKAVETGLEAARRAGQPSDLWARLLWSLFPDMESAAGSAVPAGLTPADKITRQHILFKKGLYSALVPVMSPGEIVKASLPADDKCRALFEWGTAAHKLGRKDEASQALGEVRKASCQGKILTRSLYWKGLLETQLKKYASAEETFSHLAKSSSDARYADDAYYQLYQIHRSQKNETKAAQALMQLYGLSGGDMKEKLLWEEAYAAYQEKKL